MDVDILFIWITYEIAFQHLRLEQIRSDLNELYCVMGYNFLWTNDHYNFTTFLNKKKYAMENFNDLHMIYTVLLENRSEKSSDWRDHTKQH